MCNVWGREVGEGRGGGGGGWRSAKGEGGEVGEGRGDWELGCVALPEECNFTTSLEVCTVLLCVLIESIYGWHQ